MYAKLSGPKRKLQLGKYVPCPAQHESKAKIQLRFGRQK
uniref:Uncharacterized protein n=1 Tax=Arundo donax TaxID=35708 RepID=A0A0A9GST0_ARUDO